MRRRANGTKEARALETVRMMLAERAAPEAIELALTQHHGIVALVKCHGEAHSNVFIDNCSVCAPRWGWIEDTSDAEGRAIADRIIGSAKS